MSRTSGDSGGPLDRELVAMTLLLAVAALAIPAVDAADSSPPSFEGAERVNNTVIEVDFLDGGGVDNASIEKGDFSLSTGTVENVSTNFTDGGGRAHVRLFLKEKVNEENVTVELTGGIKDESGNELTSGNDTVSGMDAVSPFLKNYTVRRVNETAAKITVVGDEKLGKISLAIGGPTTANLDMAAFSKESTNTYTHVRNFSGQGEYTLLLMDIADDSDNVRSPNKKRTFVVDTTPPTPSIAGPRRVTAGETVTFNGGASSDNVDTDTYEWRIAGTNGTKTGAEIDHTFSEPGDHRVTLSVTDTRGNVANRTILVTVRPSMSSRAVTLTHDGAGSVHAAVSGDRTAKIVRIHNSSRSLVSMDGIALEEVRVTPATNGSMNLTIATAGTPDSFDAGAKPIGAFAIEHDVDPVASEGTLRFVVARSKVEALNASAADVALYRGASGWSQLPTNLVSTNDSHLFFTARTPGFSTFVVGVTEPSGQAGETERSGTGEIVVSQASIEAGGSVGTLTVVRATLTNSGTATATRRVGLTVGGQTLESRLATVPPNETRTITFARQMETAGDIFVNGTAAGTITGQSTPTPDPATPAPTTATPEPTPDADTPTGTPAGNASDSSLGSTMSSLPVPNLTSLLPGGIVGMALGTVFWFGMLVTAALKAVAIYLGY
ncbi:MAG: PKD domain-containing protein [Haloarculaceae archaeon]